MTRTDFPTLYRTQAEEYDAMVSAEDCDGNLLPALERIVSFGNATVVDVGVGTGRIARQLLPRGARVIGVDRATAMIEVARRRLAAFPADRWELHVAGADRLPVESAVADVAIAGWTFGHMRYEHASEWQATVDRALAEMARVTGPGGTRIVIETLGTGVESPAPKPELAEYQSWLETRHGMSATWIRTDYRFSDPESAARATGFFFGAEFAERVRAHGWARIPECTGIWWTSG